ncbi:MAG: hypothetical protein JW769_05345 [Parachlamydiales bacterium]|nr:hypothetical protein [Parachlamydiales bacterium]
MEKGQKICPHCDAFIDKQVIICPYCGGDVSEEIDTPYAYVPPNRSESLTPDETLSSLYPPPYEPKVQENVSALEEEIEEDLPKRKGSIFLSTLLLSFGVNFAAMGLFLLFFSKNGEVHLRFQSFFWFLYVLTGAPAIYWGVRRLSKALESKTE